MCLVGCQKDFYFISVRMHRSSYSKNMDNTTGIVKYLGLLLENINGSEGA